MVLLRSANPLLQAFTVSLTSLLQSLLLRVNLVLDVLDSLCPSRVPNRLVRLLGRRLIVVWASRCRHVTEVDVVETAESSSTHSAPSGGSHVVRLSRCWLSTTAKVHIEEVIRLL